jgi:hypothetical protein
VSAHRIPFLPGGPLDVAAVRGVYRTLRDFRDMRGDEPRWRSLLAAVRIELAAWRYSRALQSDPTKGEG